MIVGFPYLISCDKLSDSFVFVPFTSLSGGGLLTVGGRKNLSVDVKTSTSSFKSHTQVTEGEMESGFWSWVCAWTGAAIETGQRGRPHPWYHGRIMNTFVLDGRSEQVQRVSVSHWNIWIRSPALSSSWKCCSGNRIVQIQALARVNKVDSHGVHCKRRLPWHWLCLSLVYLLFFPRWVAEKYTLIKHSLASGYGSVMVELTWVLFFDIQEGTRISRWSWSILCMLIQWVDNWINGENSWISQVGLAELMDFLEKGSILQ